MDGCTSVGRYRAYEASLGAGAKPPLLIVGMSAKDDPETRGEVAEAGMDFFVPKVFLLCIYSHDVHISNLPSLLCVSFLQPFKYPDLLALLSQRDGMSMMEAVSE